MRFSSSDKLAVTLSGGPARKRKAEVCKLPKLLSTKLSLEGKPSLSDLTTALMVLAKFSSILLFLLKIPIASSDIDLWADTELTAPKNRDSEKTNKLSILVKRVMILYCSIKDLDAKHFI